MAADSPEGITIRPATAGELVEVLTVAERAFGEDLRPEHAALPTAVMEAERTLAAYDGSSLVGAAGIFTFDMTVPGGPRPVAGVTWVGILPTHRRRGILTTFMRRQLTELHDRGSEPVAALWASEPSIYRRFGYGLGSMRLGVTAQSRLPFVHGAPAARPLHLLAADSAREQVAAVYDRVRAERPGTLSRSPARWDLLFDDSEHRREGASSLWCALLDDGGGYALYRTKAEWQDWLPKGKVIVREMVAVDAGSAASLWRYLLDIDLMASVEAWNRPLDDPLLHLVGDIRRVRPTFADALWVRIVDVERALTERTYAVAGSIVFEVVDTFCPWNAGVFSLDVDAAGGAGVVRRTDRAADITLSAVEIGSIYLGGIRLRNLAAAGFVDEHTPGAVARADAMFAGAVEPWCPEVF